MYLANTQILYHIMNDPTGNLIIIVYLLCRKFLVLFFSNSWLLMFVINLSVLRFEDTATRFSYKGIIWYIISSEFYEHWMKYITVHV